MQPWSHQALSIRRARKPHATQSIVRYKGYNHTLVPIQPAMPNTAFSTNWPKFHTGAADAQFASESNCFRKIHLTLANFWSAKHRVLYFCPVQALQVSFNTAYWTTLHDSPLSLEVKDKLGTFENAEVTVALLLFPASLPVDNSE
jgi:hypothetical protein